MKHHIIVKFIAVLLCAAALLGIAGSAAGIFVMTEMDLYSKTVDQVRDDRIQSNGKIFANAAALGYASRTLGSCPEAFVDSHYGNYWLYDVFESGEYSYTLLDAEGNEVYSYGELSENVTTYTFPVSGQYLHMVSMETMSERAAKAQADAISDSAGVVIGEGYDVTNEVPLEGTLAAYAAFYDPNGMGLYEVYEPENGAGFLYYGADGNVCFTGFASEYRQILRDSTIAGVVFFDSQHMMLYKATSPEGVGAVSFNTLGQMVFTAAEPEPEIDPVDVIETIPEETAAETTETLPEETAYVEETSAEESVEETTEETAPEEESGEESSETEAEEETEEEEHSSASDIPEEEDPGSEANESSEAEETEEAAAETEAPTEPAPTEPEPTAAPTIPEEPIAPTEPMLINGKPLDEFQIQVESYYDPALEEEVFVSYVFTPAAYTVELHLTSGALGDDHEYELLRIVQQFSFYLFPALGICLLVFSICAVYLCCAAGRKPKSEEVRAGGLNRIPLDLYFALAFGGVTLMVMLVAFVGEEVLAQNLMVFCLVAVLAAFGACLILVGFLFAFVAQIKTPGGYWWRNSLCGRCIQIFMRFGVWLEHYLALKCFPALGRLCKALWHLTCKTTVGLFHLWERFSNWLIAFLRKVSDWSGSKLHRFFSLLPITWQWLAAGFLIIFVLLISVDGFKDGNDVILPIGLLFTIAVVLYAAHCFGVLSESTKRMGKGDLDTKVDDRLLVGCFKDFAGDLNDLAGVAVVAAQKQLKSERMKTELITNVSHDIKTPLTSIINYVDLLQKPHNEEQEVQYLEVLDRQSQRLKKLIDDLMEMSKASTGNMAVEITTVDAVESVNQALGEFSDKLSAAQLTPLFRHADPSVAMRADGKLVWRVLSNILSNAVKYAMPGTRLYIDLMELEGKVVISLKNISREELNVDADELMERFVRGDDSRNTEGSGLGLNIAKSLMELQKGQLQLLVDGDLFKVTLIFPGA